MKMAAKFLSEETVVEKLEGCALRSLLGGKTNHLLTTLTSIVVSWSRRLLSNTTNLSPLSGLPKLLLH